MVIFEKVRWKNFLSTGNNWSEIHLNAHQNTLIVGENGSGKSTMLDALTFGLFGRPFRKINKPQLINSTNNSDCVVEVSFSIGKNKYLVRRGIKPTKFEIIHNGSSLNQLSSSKDFQEVLESQILKINYKSFTQVVILGSSTFVPFMQLPAAHRREVIEDLLDIKIFSAMNLLLKEDMSKTKDTITEVTNNIAIKEQLISVHNSNLSRIEADNKTIIDRHKSEINDLVDENTQIQQNIAKTESEILEHREGAGDAKTQQSKLSDAQNIEKRLVSKQTHIEKDIDFFHTTEDCPTCDQSIDEEFKCRTLEAKRAKLEEVKTAQTQIGATIQKIQSRLTEIHERQAQIDALQSRVNGWYAKCNANEQTIKSLTSTIQQLSVKGDVDSVMKEIETATSQLVALNESCEKLKLTTELHKMASNLLKDGGIKTLIVRQYLPIINKLINKHLTDMDFFVNFELDENFNEVIKSRHRDEFSYASFSEGEKMRLNLAILFAWRSVAQIKNTTNTNLLILDEVFDSSLDETGTQEFLKILHSLGEEQNVFVISHKTDILQDKFKHAIKFEKVKGFSRIV